MQTHTVRFRLYSEFFVLDKEKERERERKREMYGMKFLFDTPIHFIDMDLIHSIFMKFRWKSNYVCIYIFRRSLLVVAFRVNYLINNLNKRLVLYFSLFKKNNDIRDLYRSNYFNLFSYIKLSIWISCNFQAILKQFYL